MGSLAFSAASWAVSRDFPVRCPRSGRRSAGWGKDERRSVFQTFNLAVLLAALVSHALSGFLTAELGKAALIALPGTVIGSWLGVRAYGKLSDHVFHKTVLCLLGASGMILVWGVVS